MPMLKRLRYEKMAQGLVAGLTRHQAYLKAGFKGSDANARRVAGHPQVVARVQELMALAAEQAGVSRTRIQQELACIAFGTIKEVAKWESNLTEISEDNETGLPKFRSFNQITLIDSDTLTDTAARSIAEVSQGQGGQLRVKMHDKLKALDMLGRDIGMWSSDQPNGPDLNITMITPTMQPAEARDAYLQTLRGGPDEIKKLSSAHSEADADASTELHRH